MIKEVTYENILNYKIKINKAYLINALILLVLVLAYDVLYPKADNNLKLFMTIIISYVTVANIIGLLLRKYGVIYTKYKPKHFCIDNKMHFGLIYNNRIVYNTYYGYRCWDFSDVMYKNHHDSTLNHFRRYYRTENGPIIPVVKTNNRLHAKLTNILVTIGLFLTIFIYKE